MGMDSSRSRSWVWPCALWGTCPVRWNWLLSCRDWTWMVSQSLSTSLLFSRFHTNKRSVCLLIICETALQSVTDPFQSLHWTDIWYSEQFMLRSDHRIEQFIQHRGAVNTPVSEVNSENPTSYCVCVCVCVSGFKWRQGQVTVDWTVWEHALI